MALVDLAQRLSQLIEGSVSYVVQVESPADLRHKVHEHQPDIVILDWRMGGSRWRAIDEVTAIGSRTSTHPYVILMLPNTSTTIEREDARLGCYDVVSVSDEDFEHQVVDAVETASRARLVRRVPRRRVTRGDLH